MNFFTLDIISVCVYECIYAIEMELNIVVNALLYLNRSHVQYSLCTVLTYTTAVPLDALKTKLVTDPVSVLALHLQITQNKSKSAVDDVSSRHVQLSCLLIAFCVIVCSSAERNRKL